MHPLLAWLLLLTVPLPVGAAPPGLDAPCPEPEARQFDFWLGEWEIRQEILQADRSWAAFPATTVVTTAVGGCAIHERWRGTVRFYWQGMERPEPMEGLSLRYYDPDPAEWTIHWMDERSPRLGEPFRGRFDEAGRGVFLRAPLADGTPATRIIFDPATSREVGWELAVSTDGGATWLPIWRMRMTRAAG